MPATPIVTGKPYVIVRTTEQARSVLLGMRGASRLWIDTETKGQCDKDGHEYSALILHRARLALCQIAAQGDEKVYVFLIGEPHVRLAVFLSLVRPLLEHPRIVKVFHNANYDTWVFYNYGIRTVNFEDTMVMGACVNEEAGASLKERAVEVGMLLKKTRTVDFDNLEDAAEYSADDVVATRALDRLWWGKPRPLGKRTLYVGGNLQGVRRMFYDRQEREFLKLCIEMERRGVLIDLAKLRHIDGKIQADMGREEAAIYKCAGKPFKITSTKQLAEVLYDHLGLTCPDDCHTPSGAPSTDARTLFYLNGQHPIIDHLLSYRRMTKLREVYTSPDTGLPYYCDDRGYLHASFNVGATKTGRLSMSNPNLQTIPSKRDTYGIRECFVAPRGKVLIVYDLSQIEVRMQVIFSQCRKMIEEYRNPKGDIYLRTAREFGSPDPAADRQLYKVIVLALQYGMGTWTYADNLTMQGYPRTPHQAKSEIQRYFSVYPEIPEMWHRVFQQHLRDGFVPMLTGFPRAVEGFYSTFVPGSGKIGLNEKERMLINNLMQGCLCGSQRIFVRGLGSVALSDVPRGRSVRVWDGTKFARGFVVPSGRKPLFDIELQGGLHLRCSPEHRFLTVNTLGHELWKTPEQFSKQEYVRLAAAIPRGWQSAAPVLSVGVAHNSRGVDFRCVEPRRLGEWLGRVASDGSCVRGKGVTVLVADSEADIYAGLKATSLRLVPHISERRQGTKKLRDMYLACKRLADFLLDSGLKREIPQWVWADRERLRGYLCGMFDGDGYITSAGVVSLTFGQGGRHLRWAEQVQQALFLYGIRSRVQPMRDRTVVQVQRRDTRLYAQEIGFMSSRKTARLASAPFARRTDGEKYGRMSRVVSVTDTGERVEMFDFVNSSTHRFAANGVVTHNSAAHFLKQSMLRMEQHPVTTKYGYRQCLQIHDEVFAVAPEQDAEELALEVCAVATRLPEEPFAPVYEVPIPIRASIGVGKTWKEAKR